MAASRRRRGLDSDDESSSAAAGPSTSESDAFTRSAYATRSAYEQPVSAWSKFCDACCGRMAERYFLSRYQVASSTTLQMMLYFNVLAAVVWAYVHIATWQWKVVVWPPPILPAMTTPLLFYVWLLLEPIRLLLGYVGNLSERVAWLMPFWVLTIFPQLLVHIYFVFIQDLIAWVVLPIEQVMSVAFIVLYLFELGVGYGTARRLVSKATADYQLALNEGELVT